MTVAPIVTFDGWLCLVERLARRDRDELGRRYAAALEGEALRLGPPHPLSVDQWEHVKRSMREHLDDLAVAS